MQLGGVSGGEMARLAGQLADAKKASAGDNTLRETARQFEALFVKQLMSQVDIAGGIGGEDNAQSDFVNSMWRDKISQQMTAGDGLGLAKMLVQQLGGASASPLRSTEGLVRPLAPKQLEGGSLYNLYGAPPSTEFSSREEFVAQMKPHIEAAAKELGISPRTLLAQAALETGWGQHMPKSADGRPSNNLFGIKADSSWTGSIAEGLTQEFNGGRFETIRDGFRQYDHPADSVRDYVAFLRDNPRYRDALKHGGSDENFLQGLKSAGYATDPQYVDKVIGVADSPSMERYWNAI